jgi:hypothetical protein
MTMTCGQWGRLTVFAVLALAVPRLASAQDTSEYKNHLYDKLQVGLSFTTVLNNSDVRVDGTSGNIGTNINFRDLLGLSGSTVQPAIVVGWKPGRKTELDLGYQFLNQSGSRAFSDSLVIGDNEFFGDINLNTKLGADNATLQFKYSLFAKERHNIGLAIGLGAIFFSAKFTGSVAGSCVGVACDSTAAGEYDVNIDEKLTGPTASIGAFGNWRLGDRWYVGGDARGLGARVDRFDISIFEADANVRYYLSNRWGMGLGWYYTNVTVNVGAKSDNAAVKDLVGKLAYAYTSLRLGVIAAF